MRSASAGSGQTRTDSCRAGSRGRLRRLSENRASGARVGRGQPEAFGGSLLAGEKNGQGIRSHNDREPVRVSAIKRRRKNHAKRDHISLELRGRMGKHREAKASHRLSDEEVPQDAARFIGIRVTFLDRPVPPQAVTPLRGVRLPEKIPARPATRHPLCRARDHACPYAPGLNRIADCLLMASFPRWLPSVATLPAEGTARSAR